MAVQRVPVELDQALLERARAASDSGGVSNTEVVEDALAFYLGMRALDDAHAQGGLDEEEASRLAVDEVRAYRRTRDAAA